MTQNVPNNSSDIRRNSLVGLQLFNGAPVALAGGMHKTQRKLLVPGG